MPDTKRPLKLFNQHFLLLWQSQAVSLLGTQAYVIAMAFWIKRTFDSATLMSLMPMLSSLPAALLAPFGGVVADRYSRRTIIILSNAVRGTLILGLAGLAYFMPEHNTLLFVCLLIVTVISSVISSIFIPAVNAITPDLVPEAQVARANFLIQGANQIATLLGQGLGGMLFRLLGAPFIILANALSFLAAALCQCFITLPQSAPKNRSETRAGQFQEDLREAWHYLWQQTGLKRVVIVSTLISFFFAGVLALAPAYVDDFLKVRPDWVGYLAAASGIGTFFGFILAGAFKMSGSARAAATLLFVALNALGVALLGALVNQYVALMILFGCGVATGFITISINTLMQVATPREMRGRLFGLLATSSGTIAPLGMGLAGIITDLLDKNVPLVYLISGIMMLLLSLLLAASPDARAFLAYQPKEAVPEEAGETGTHDESRTTPAQPVLLQDSKL
ncbi:MAG TPA: MFS transporter [Blastocatellia bacterium]|nr:MFS transporter [Blastocatellia bacterium]